MINNLKLVLTVWLIIFVLQGFYAQRLNSGEGQQDDSRCQCMEYWECVTRGGKPNSYCGPSENQVCCFIPKNARPIGILPKASPASKCGRKGQAIDSSNNGKAEVGEWPWHAAILEISTRVYVCGASLIDEKWLLTAAHCVYPYSGSVPPQLQVRVGEFDVSHNDERYQYEEVDVESIVVHPEFINTTLLNDIALLKLTNKLRKRPNVDIICLSEEPSPEIRQMKEQTACAIIGWGRINETTDHSNVLKEILVPLWSNSDCQKALKSQFGEQFVLPHASICAGAENMDACDGDGGGPLMCEFDGRWEQVGIVSYGVGCGRRHLPGVYSRIVAYSKWIKQSIRTFS